MQTLRVVWTIFAKDLRIEWRHRETLVSMCLFGILVVFLFNFAFEPGREETLRLIPGLLWVAFAFAGVLGFNRSFAAERENAGLEGMRLALLGLIVGIAGAFAAGRVLASLLHEVKPGDPVIFVATAGLLAAVALVACFLPARRAARLDPMVALRYE